MSEARFFCRIAPCSVLDYTASKAPVELEDSEASLTDYLVIFLMSPSGALKKVTKPVDWKKGLRNCFFIVI